jgi:hypothetical protein
MRVDGSRTAAGATYLGAMTAVQYGAGSLHGRTTIGKVDDFTMVVAVVVAAAAALA